MVVIPYYLIYSVGSIETITSRKMALYRLAKRKLLLLEIFVHSNFGSVYLRYILSVIIFVHALVIQSFGGVLFFANIPCGTNTY